LAGPSARARAWNGHPGFRDREKAPDWVQTGLDLILDNHPMATTLTLSSSDTRPKFHINGPTLSVAAPTVPHCPDLATP